MKLKLKIGQTEKEYEGTWDEIVRVQYFEEQDKSSEQAKANFMDEVESAVYGDLVAQKFGERFEPEDEEENDEKELNKYEIAYVKNS